MLNYTLGLHVVSPGRIRVYENDHYLWSFDHPVKSGGYVGLAGKEIAATVESFEAWDLPGGSILWSDTFASLAAWSDAYNGGGWSASGGKAVLDPAFVTTSSVIVRPTAGATYFVARGISGSTGTNFDRWVMLDVFRDATGRSDEPPDAAWKGYRLLVRDNSPGTGVPGSSEHLEVVNPTSGGFDEGLSASAGWSAGVIRR